MTTKMFRGLLLATTVAAVLAAPCARAADAPQPKLSSGVGTALSAAQKAANAKDWKAALAAIEQAKAASGRTPFDDYKIAQYQMILEVNAGDMAAAAAAADVAVNAPGEPDADKASNLRSAIILALNEKLYDKAAGYSKMLTPLNPTDPKTILAMAQAYSLTKDYTDALAITQKSIAADVAANRMPDRGMLEMQMNAQVGVKDEAGAETTLELLVADYNQPNDWAQMVDIAFGSKGLRDIDGVWLGRLLFVSGAQVSAQDATIIGSTASHLTFYGDAQVAQQHGGTGFPDANAAAAKDKATMSAQIAAGQKANGQFNVKLAEALYGYGMYPEAEAAARLSIQKGGAADPFEAPMVLGQTLAAEGKYDDALASFAQVTGGSPATPRIVRLWVDYTKSKKAPPAPPAPAPAPAQ